LSRKTANIDVRVEPELIARIEAWIDQQGVSLSFSATLVFMIEDFLEREEQRAVRKRLRLPALRRTLGA